jgi:hypothetical protein
MKFLEDLLFRLMLKEQNPGMYSRLVTCELILISFLSFIIAVCMPPGIIRRLFIFIGAGALTALIVIIVRRIINRWSGW